MTGQEPPATEKLIELAAALNRQCDAAGVVRTITGQAAALLRAEHVFLFMLNPRTRETLRTMDRHSTGTSDPLLRQIETYTSGWIMRCQQPLHSPDLTRDERFKGIKFTSGAQASAIGVPLMSESLILGSLVLINRREESAFQPLHLNFLIQLGEIIAPFLRSSQQFQPFFDKPLPEPLLQEKYARLGLLGRSEPFVALLKGIESAAACDVRVLLQGASGTGKELVARAIHRMSSRWSGPFLAIDCGAIAPGVVESELMGHVRGAFTGAAADRKGLLESAHEGTLFMDEVVNLPLDMQSKLLRVLQEGEIRPVGSSKTRRIDVRIITAASSSLEKRVETGHFREDLYYRLYVFPILVPSLQLRREDIGLLAGHFLNKFAGQQNKQLGAFHPEIVDYLKRRPWPGNIRELENMVERLVTLAPRDLPLFTRDYLPPELRREAKSARRQTDEEGGEAPLAEKIAAYEAQLIRRALEEHGWNQSRAARALKLPVQTLHYKVEKLKIKP